MEESSNGQPLVTCALPFMNTPQYNSTVPIHPAFTEHLLFSKNHANPEDSGLAEQVIEMYFCPGLLSPSPGSIA